MAARTPRRTFANPFVITLAATGCYTEVGTPPPQQPPPTAQPAPAPQQPAPPETGVVTNPPRPAPPPVQPAPPAPPAPPAGGTTTPAPGTVVVAEPKQTRPGTFDFEQRWYVTKQGATCRAMPKVDCPKPTKQGGPMPTCNPPPPMKYACPPNMTEPSLTVVQYAGSPDCVVEAAPVKCPPNVMCNPPPPQKVACPKY